jgi:hypothetical protein
MTQTTAPTVARIKDEAAATEISTLRAVLRTLANACALTLPASAWSTEIYDALTEATRLIGPMA